MNSRNHNHLTIHAFPKTLYQIVSDGKAYLHITELMNIRTIHYSKGT